MKLIRKQKAVIDNAATGAAARKHRRAKRLSLHEVARRMRFSAQYVSDLEIGRRNWSQQLLESFEDACSKRNPNSVRSDGTERTATAGGAS